MAAVAGYRDLSVWQRAMDLVVECYKVTDGFPRTETYGLSSQIRRAAVSVPANIAEGAGRTHTKEYHYHVSVARGSVFELQTELIAAERLGYIPSTRLEPLLAASDEVSRMLSGLLAALDRKLAECG